MTMPTIKYNEHTKRMIQAMYKMTDENNHSGAYVVGASLIGEHELSDKFLAISERSEEAGSISPADYNTRYLLYTNLIELAETKLSASAYSKFYGAL